MNHKHIIKKRFERRLFITGAIKSMAMSCLVGRLYYLQIFENSRYKLLSDYNRINVSFVNALRGGIFDSTGIQLADNKKQYNVAFHPTKGINIDYVVKKLLSILNLLQSHYERIYDLLDNAIETTIIQEDIDWSILQKIEFNNHDLHGIIISVDYKRVYYKGPIFSHIIGYARRVISRNDICLYVGKRGIEYSYDGRLKGNPGIVQQEINSKRQIIKSLSKIVSKPGEDIHLSIKYQLQSFIFKILKNIGSVVVMDVNSGEIIAMNNFPHYDNNLFIKPILKSTWDALTKNQDSPLLNRAVAMQIPPGSTFKMISALAALEGGLITAETKCTCRGHINIGGHDFHCWKREGHGSISLNKAISSSCNVYFYNIGREINIDRLLKVAEIFGLGKILGLGVREEASGIIPNRQWRDKYYKDSHWYTGDTINSIIGHGYLLATPLQLAVMTARIATGKEVSPSLIKNHEKKKFNHLNIRNDHLRLVREGMYNAVRFGTAHRLYSHTQEIAGKTGTAQLVSLKNGNNNHSLFVGYSSYKNPKYAISVVLERSEISGRASVIAKQVFDYIYQYNI